MLVNKKTNGFLVMNIGKKTECLEEQYEVTTTSKDMPPCARSVFHLQRVDDMDIFGGRGDQVIKYGQKIRLTSNPYIFRKPLFLGSLPLGPSAHA